MKNNHNTQNDLKDCFDNLKKNAIFVVIAIIIFMAFPPFSILLLFLIIFKKKFITNIFDKSGVIECFKKIQKHGIQYSGNNDIYKLRLENLENHKNSVNNRINRENNEIKRRKEKLLRQTSNNSYNELINKQKPNKTSTFEKKQTKKDTFKYNGGKSIWDDYESVIK